MTHVHTARIFLAAALASALCWQASAAAASASTYGVRATFESRHFILEMRLPLLCLRLVGEITDPPPAIAVPFPAIAVPFPAVPGFIIASAYSFACEACPRASGARRWS